ncbi:EF-hand domain-containing protein [Congregibacter sp.]|uniref:EF-hand domain-containing protein n=1 Tax=Congregibacter sp. TaxID=2744308 RepID=UPI003F6AEBC7
MKKKLLFWTGTVTLLSSITAMAQAEGGMLKLDADGDGQVSREEFQPRGDRGGPRIFKRADVDGDGEITRDEMLSALDTSDERHKNMRKQLPQMFDQMDTDGNGVVSRGEAQDHAFQRLDSDGDGFVSEAEAKSMHDKRGGRRHRQGDGERSQSQD